MPILTHTHTHTLHVESASLEWVCSVLVIADQLLLTRLKNLCEKALAKACKFFDCSHFGMVECSNIL